MNKKVLITRPEADSVILAEQVRAMGAEAVIAPMMTIRVLDTDLPDLQKYDALAFTSANGVQAFAGKSDVRTHKCFCVGGETAARARAEGFTNIYEAGGKAESLADLIIAKRPKRVLYCAPEHKAYPFLDRLREGGVLCEEVVLYVAEPRMHIPDNIKAMMAQNDIDFALFFSKRTAQIFMDLVEREGCTPALKSIKALCLSDSVVQSAQAGLWARTYVSGKPDSGSMLLLLEQILKDGR